MAESIINKVAESGLITINLEEYLPTDGLKVFDLKDYLFMGLILKEKEFRATLLEHDWTAYKGFSVAVTCSTDAIIPVWAYMLVAGYLEPISNSVRVCTPDQLREQLLTENINKINGHDFLDKRIVIKGCGEVPIPESAYLAITLKLRPFAKSIMYGEPCSTVPVYKKPKEQ